MTEKNEPAAEPVSVEWKDIPVRPARQKSRVRLVVEQLKQYPGRSARVARNVKSSSATATWRSHGCVAQVRQAEDDPKLHDVYAWWPEPDEAAADVKKTDG